MNNEKDYLLSETRRILNDENSDTFYVQMMELIGENLYSELLGELKIRLHEGIIQQPVSYFAVMLRNEAESASKRDGKKQKEELLKLQTFFHSNKDNLFQSLYPKLPENKVESKQMAAPYSDKTIPWATFLTSDFFTISSNKNKSDQVTLKMQTHDEKNISVPLVRGRYNPTGKEYGILTAYHYKVLAGLQVIWASEGCPFHEFKNDSKVCYCYVKLADICKLLGYKESGGSIRREVINAITDLKSFPYYLDLTKYQDSKNIKSFAFTLLNKVEIAEKRGTHGETLLSIEFSDPLSRQLLERRSITMAREILHVRSEIAVLVEAHIVPKLFSLEYKNFTQIYQIKLKNLVEDLHLPVARWNRFQSGMNRVFSEVVSELNDKKVSTGKHIKIWITRSFNEYYLNAKLYKKGYQLLTSAPTQNTPRL